LEARENNDIILRMMKSVNLNVLKRNIVDTYYLYIEEKNGQYTRSIFINPEKNDTSGFIIETAFNIFIILSTF